MVVAEEAKAAWARGTTENSIENTPLPAAIKGTTLVGGETEKTEEIEETETEESKEDSTMGKAREGAGGGEEEITAGAIAQADRTPPVTALGGEEVPVVPAAVGAAAARAVGANRMTASFRLRQRTIVFLQARICSTAVLGGVG